ncbi:MAG TPA: TetR/AcrR family transcriptional regulator [Bryobacteraceae bacterium]|nr:TetR/AcrR family transcriptional regulator [Bryobacteraceae bacterium]
MAQRREREKAELREQILKAARAIVLKEGFEALSMRKIAQAIEYSPATIYLHFPSREEIARQLTREAFGELLAYLAPLASIKDPMGRVRAFGKAYVKFGLTKPESYRLCFMTSQDLSSEIFPTKNLDNPNSDEPGDRALQLVASTVRELVDAGRIAPTDPNLTAYLLWSNVHGIVSLQLNCPSMAPFSIDELTNASLDVIEKGLVADAPRRTR